MKKFQTLSITLLLTLLAGAILTIGYSHHHHPAKAITVFEEWSINTLSDDEEKPVSHLTALLVIVLISPIGVFIRSTITRPHVYRLRFLIPIFHQSNYVIHFPATVS